MGILSSASAWFLVSSAVLAVLATAYQWPRHWILSGAGPASYILFYTAVDDNRSLPTWTILTTLNLAYAVASTSWLLSSIFAAIAWPLATVLLLHQSPAAGLFARRRARALLRGFQLTHDQIALFNIPALEIDREVDGLMAIRGVTLSLSTLTVTAHGIEVGIKFSDDMELAMVVDTVKIRLFRSIDISDVYANIKGGKHEMTFAHLDERSRDTSGHALMNDDSPLLRAAAFAAYSARTEGKFPMTEVMTGGPAPADSTTKEALHAIKHLSPDEKEAGERYDKAIENIAETSMIQVASVAVQAHVAEENPEMDLEKDGKRLLRAAICSRLHTMPTVPHAPKQSVRVTTLQNMSSPQTRRFLHRLPLLLRLLLAPIAALHPVRIASLTGGASGEWADSLLSEHVLSAGGGSEPGIRHVARRVRSWLADARFTLQVADIRGAASVPVRGDGEIRAAMAFGDFAAHRTVPEKAALAQVLRLGGADAAVSLPAYLLPHHEHLLPPYPTEKALRETRKELSDATEAPEAVRARGKLLALKGDVTALRVSAHAHLPAQLDQSLLDFSAALIKAAKLVEIEADPDTESSGESDDDSDGDSDALHGKSKHKRAATDTGVQLAPAKSSSTSRTAANFNANVATFKQLARGVGKTVSEGVRDGLKRAAIDATLQDRWLARLVGKALRKLSRAQGDVGYSGDLPLPLAVYRENGRGEASKLLP